MAAVREVLAEIGAADVPEIVVINKADAADPVVVKGLEANERGCVVVSARTGAGIEDLLAAVDAGLPRRDQEIACSCPTSAATWWPGRTRRARCSRCGTRRRAPARPRAVPPRPGGGADRRGGHAGRADAADAIR